MTPPDTSTLQLTEAFGRGFSVDSLTPMRWFYLIYGDRLAISEKPSRISAPPRLPVRNLETPSPESPSLKTFDASIHAREYTLALPSAEELRLKLLEWTEEP